MEPGAIIPVLASIAALVTAIGTLIKIRNDRKTGVEGTMLKAKEVEGGQFSALVEAQNLFSQSAIEEARAAKAEAKEATAKVAELALQLATVIRRTDRIEYILTVYEVREGILVKHIEAGGGPPVPVLPPLPKLD